MNQKMAVHLNDADDVEEADRLVLFVKRHVIIYKY